MNEIGCWVNSVLLEGLLEDRRISLIKKQNRSLKHSGLQSLVGQLQSELLREPLRKVVWFDEDFKPALGII